MYQEIIDRQETLERLYDLATAFAQSEDVDAELISALNAYLCVRTYAFVETSVRTVLLRYVRSVSHDAATENFVHQQLRRNRNLDRDNLVHLLGRFDSHWRLKLREETKGDEIKDRLKDSLDSIVNTRNNIAHGDDVNISLDSLKGYFADAQTIVDLVFHICQPPSPDLAAS